MRLRSRSRWSGAIWRWHLAIGAGLAIACLCGPGCRFPGSKQAALENDDYYRHAADEDIAEIVTQAVDPDTSLPAGDVPSATPQPRTIVSELPGDDENQYWNLSLTDALQYGLSNSRVLTDLGGTILRNPDAMPSNMMSAIVQTDPRFGIEGALSAFDARLNLSSSLENNDRALNNLFLSGGNTGRSFTQTYETTRLELLKRTVTGGQVALRNVTEFDRNSAPSNLFGSAWNTYYEAEARQSLLQGGGVQFNRIAGPYAQPGYYNGVKIARVNADISQAEFEIGLRDYLSNLENAYWDLQFAYRELASKLDLRDSTLEIYQEAAAKSEGEDNLEARYRLFQIKEQYYRFQEEVQNALSGRRVDGTRTNNGSVPGTFRGGSGVYVAERRLRLLMGVPTTEQRLIRPVDEPTLVETVPDWELVKADSLTRRPELDRQRFRIHRAELELTASRNYLKPTLDLVGRYRFRGFGKQFVGYDNDPNSGVPAERFQNAFGNLMNGQYQESQVGVEFSMPIGYRQGHAAVAHAEFRVARERAVLYEQERQIVHDVGNALADQLRTYEVAKTAFERRSAAKDYLDSIKERKEREKSGEQGTVTLDQWLEAQRRFAEADTQYHLAMADHQISLKNLNYERGALLEYCNVMSVDTFPSVVTPPAVLPAEAVLEEAPVEIEALPPDDMAAESSDAPADEDAAAPFPPAE